MNPYQTRHVQTETLGTDRKPRSRIRWLLAGFALGAGVPVTLGIIGMLRE
ncbi:MAG: hypothetical protein AAFU85_33070 [Planctomycetota bacterium]